MHPTRSKTAGALALAALTATAGLALAPAASALTTGDAVVDGVTTPNVGIGKSAQPAGDITVEPDVDTASWENGDQVLIQINDSDGDTGDCDIEFTDVPSVSLDGSATVVASLETEDCGAGGTDVLRLNFTSGGTGDLLISSIEYDVAAGAALGEVDYDLTASTVATTEGDGNAFLTTVIVDADNPTLSVHFDSGDQAISPITLAEQVPAALDGEQVCISILNGSWTFDSTSPPAPTASSTGSDTPTVSYLSSTTLLLTVPDSADAAHTYTIDSLFLDTSSDFSGDQVEIDAFIDEDGGSDCADTGDDDAPDLFTVISDPTLLVAVVEAERFGGANRHTTAQILFEDEFSCSGDYSGTAIIARGDDFPDALAGNYLAGWLDTGILLTQTDQLPQATLNVLRNEGIGTVYLLGETEAISQGVEDFLRNEPDRGCGGGLPADPTTEKIDVHRLGGANRYETMKIVNEFPGLSNPGTFDGDPTTNNICDDGGTNEEPLKTTAIVATGQNFPDALASGPLAFDGDGGDCGSGELPMILTRGTTLSGPASDALINLGIEQVIIMGGTDALSAGVESAIAAMGIDTFRIAGANRQETAIALYLHMETSIHDWDDDDFTLARGDDFADALTGGPWSGNNNPTDPILLVQNPTTLGASTQAFLESHVATLEDFIDQFRALGGTAAISAAVFDAVVQALGVDQTLESSF